MIPFFDKINSVFGKYALSFWFEPLGGSFCVNNTITAVCKLYEITYKSVQTLPDFLNCLLAVDRFLAVRYSTWYRDICTRKAAWVVIVPVMMIRLPDVVIRLIKIEVIPGMGCFLSEVRNFLTILSQLLFSSSVSGKINKILPQV